AGSLVAALWLEKERDAATEKLWQAKLEEARARLRSPEMGRRDLVLAALADAARIRLDADVRNEALACLALLDVRVARESVWPADAGEAYFDSTLDRYACLDSQGAVSIRQAGDNVVLRRLPGTGYSGVPWFSPDDRFLGIRSGDDGSKVKVWDLSGEV